MRENNENNPKMKTKMMREKQNRRKGSTKLENTKDVKKINKREQRRKERKGSEGKNG